mmetsp:Transcript_69024/g.152319  ORF Transcript_69024/g.152319 Transcript_69024/m.152319 type:complete len:255 (-) Transcript_69024:1244-2008(-)
MRAAGVASWQRAVTWSAQTASSQPAPLAAPCNWPWAPPRRFHAAAAKPPAASAGSRRTAPALALQPEPPLPWVALQSAGATAATQPSAGYGSHKPEQWPPALLLAGSLLASALGPLGPPGPSPQSVRRSWSRHLRAGLRCLAPLDGSWQRQPLTHATAPPFAQKPLHLPPSAAFPARLPQFRPGPVRVAPQRPAAVDANVPEVVVRTPLALLPHAWLVANVKLPAAPPAPEVAECFAPAPSAAFPTPPGLASSP